MMLQLLIWAPWYSSAAAISPQIGILGLGINSGAYVAEIIRGGLMAVEVGQMEAGRSLGLNYFDTMRFIVIPQAIKAILPALGNEFIILLKDTSLITIIGGKELLHAAQGHHGPYLRGNVPSDRHRLHVSCSGHDLHLASGQTGKEAASK